jgi:hypothetical protein
MSVRAICTWCREAIVTTRALPLGAHHVEALATHVRGCERIPPAERVPGGIGLLANLLRYFDVDIRLG